MGAALSPVANPLLVGLEEADGVVRVTLVDSGHPVVLAVVPRVLGPVRNHDTLCGDKQTAVLRTTTTYSEENGPASVIAYSEIATRLSRCN